MKYLIIPIIIIALISCKNSDKQNDIKKTSSIILIKVSDFYNDTVSVEYILPKINKDSIVFKFPKVIPGTYEYYFSSSYIKNLKFCDVNDSELNFKRIDSSSYLIPLSRKLKSIKYEINKASVFDCNDVVSKTVVADSFVVVNPFSIFGYLDKYSNLPHILELTKHTNFLFSLSSKMKEKTATSESYIFSNYRDLGENPILYCKPDTVSLLKDINATISVYSENKNITAPLIASWIQPLTNSLLDFTSNIHKDKNPYRFIFVFSKKIKTEIAIEHRGASIYCMRANWDTTFLKEVVQQFTSHEYLHTLTPINFHSELYLKDGLDNYSSKHLWLYEGVTEYLSLSALLASKQINLNVFFKRIAIMNYLSSNLKESKNKSLIEISENILNSNYSNCFNDFYLRGALFAFCVDLTISIESKGKSNLIKELKKYIVKNGNIFSEDNFLNDFFDPMKYSKLSSLKRNLNSKLPINLNSYFQEIGYSLSNNIFGIQYLYNDFGIVNYSKNNDFYEVSFDKYSNMVDRKIRITRINNKRISETLFDKQIIFPPNSNLIELEYYKNGIKKTHKLKPHQYSVGYLYKDAIKDTKQTVLTKKNLFYYLSQK